MGYKKDMMEEIMKKSIFIVTGAPGCGKSTISKALVKRYDFGMILPIEIIRELVISGYSGPIPEWTEETTRQFDLSFTATASLAKLYNDNNFAVAIEPVLYPNDVEEKIVNFLEDREVIRIFLSPSLDSILSRNKDRRTKDFNTKLLEDPIKAMYPVMINEISNNPKWITIDSTEQTVEETVDMIIKLSVSKERD